MCSQLWVQAGNPGPANHRIPSPCIRGRAYMRVKATQESRTYRRGKELSESSSVPSQPFLLLRMSQLLSARKFTWLPNPGFELVFCHLQTKNASKRKISSSPKPKHDLVVAEVSIIINRQDGLCLDFIPGQESIVQAVLLSTDHLQRGRKNTLTINTVLQKAKPKLPLGQRKLAKYTA